MTIPKYLMESTGEAARLLNKTDFGLIEQQLKLTRFLELKPHSKVCDAGCGIGVIGKTMVTLADRHSLPIEITLLDQSEDRLKIAANQICNTENSKVHTQHSSLEKINIPNDSFDYIFCRFVFEYLPEPLTVFKELTRVLRKGGKLVIGDLDYNSMIHYPFPPELEENLFCLVNQLIQTKLWDPYAGRKIYGYFSQSTFQNIEVHVSAHHLIYNDISERDLSNWIAKLDQIQDLVRKKVINVPFDFAVFQERFLTFLKLRNRFSYTPLILVEGIKTQ